LLPLNGPKEMVSVSVKVLPFPPAVPLTLHWLLLRSASPPGVTPGNNPAPASFSRYSTFNGWL